ncbi:helix-turn-helix domain-containing protein [Streptomyces sp. NPDC005953]|uniref:helix-turn-helix domain-containing protein n=1 Tax=Streptomyces sp. NPDC005953 TaxID=3156719 RepID=UPI0033E39D53
MPPGTLVADFGRCCPTDTGTGGQGPAAWENCYGLLGTDSVGWPLGEADVGQIEQGLERALRARPVPSSTEARLRFLLATHRGSTQQVATVLGVSQRTVQRWVTKKPGARRLPGRMQVRAIEEAVGTVAAPNTGLPACPGRGGGLRLPYQGAVAGSRLLQVPRRIRGCGGSLRICRER